MYLSLECTPRSQSHTATSTPSINSTLTNNMYLHSLTEILSFIKRNSKVQAFIFGDSVAIEETFTDEVNAVRYSYFTHVYTLKQACDVIGM